MPIVIQDDPVHKTEFYLGDDISTLAGSPFDSQVDTERDSLMGTPCERFFEASPRADSLVGVNPFILGDIIEGRTQAYLAREKHFERYGVYDGLP